MFFSIAIGSPLELASGYMEDGIEAVIALKKAIAAAELWFLDSEG